MSDILVHFSEAQRTIVEQFAKRHRVAPGEFCQAFVMMYLEGLDSQIDLNGMTQYADDILNGIERYVDNAEIPEWLAPSE